MSKSSVDAINQEDYILVHKRKRRAYALLIIVPIVIILFLALYYFVTNYDDLMALLYTLDNSVHR